MATISSELLEEERRIFGAQFASPACEEALANTEVVKRHSHCNVCVWNQTTPNQNTNTQLLSRSYSKNHCSNNSWMRSLICFMVY